MSGRIRTIKPELRDDPAFARLTDRAVRLFCMLLTLVDDGGHCPATPAYLAGQIFYARSCSLNAIGQALAELEGAGFIKRYTAAGAEYLEIAGWADKGSRTHQRIDKPQPLRWPVPEWFRSANDSGNESATDSKTDQTSTSRSDLRPGPDRDPESEAAVQAADSSAAAGGWKPPPGGMAERLAAERVAAGEIASADVARCWAAFVAAGAHVKPNADAIAAKWIAKQRPSKTTRKRALELEPDHDKYEETP